MLINNLKDKQIVLGISGGIAAYKSADLTSKLVQAGARVDVVMTEAATRFITPLTLQALTHRRIYLDEFDIPPGQNIPHIELAHQPDLIIVAPATANTLAKVANGLADNLLTAILLAASKPVLIAPAMETHMWAAPATRANMVRLEEWGLHQVGPAEGRLASGKTGAGRMAEPVEIIETARLLLAQNGLLAGKKVLVTAGGTREPLDPVRFITNRSSGKMGHALAEVARDWGAKVTLITTAALPAPQGATVFRVETAAEMNTAVLANIPHTHALVMAAAVADYKPAQPTDQKIKKNNQALQLSLRRTEDILQNVGAYRAQNNWPRVVVGFAAETQNLLENAAAKITAKQLDFIAANDVSHSDSGFGVDTNAVTLLFKGGKTIELPLLSKFQVAGHIWQQVHRCLTGLSDRQ